MPSVDSTIRPAECSVDIGVQSSSDYRLALEYLTVTAKYRRVGICSLMVQKLLESDRFGPADFLVANELLEHDPETNLSEKEQRISQIAFLHRNHFRRIGRTSCMICSFDSNHPSRHLSPDNEPGSNETLYLVGAPDKSEQLFLMKILHAEMVTSESEMHTLHNAIRHYTLKGALKDRQMKPIDVSIRECCSRNPAKLHEQDHRGLTPLHTAAMYSDLLSVKTLLELGAREDLTKRDNTDGMTPYEFIAEIMGRQRRQEEMRHGRWSGHPDQSLEIAWTFEKAQNENVGTFQEYITKRKWGCTCGACIDGWMSPRMRFRIACQGASLHDMMSLSRPSFHPGRATEMDLVNGIGLDYMPARIRKDITRELWESYRDVVQVIYLICCTEDPSMVPTPLIALQSANVMGNPRPYIEQGAKTEYAVDLVVSGAKNESKLVDNEFDDSMADPIMGEAHDKWVALPKCENELDFVMVRTALNILHHPLYLPSNLEEALRFGTSQSLDAGRSGDVVRGIADFDEAFEYGHQ
ncbi:hypothetical protein EUX98_g5790 [Antrodiella citrinella]|uniref:Uncharacterized protein n=1 Tax=Antrodiella citrinella TaxID=2447956 RepID=A0A4S4MQK8_9APHY|nr:hypothetical protein EUX98_g5790 [Antrodiella citrinella]